MLSETLYLVSASLLIPVIAVLLGLTAYTALIVGGFAREWLARSAVRRNLRLVTGALRGDSLPAATEMQAVAQSLPAVGFVPRYLRSCWLADATPASAERSIDEMELEMSQGVGRLTTLARLGPMLGLMGTLIPLGPALIELSRGNLSALAAQVVVAFSTTVVGLLLGIVAFACGQARRGWYARDLCEILHWEGLRTARETTPHEAR